MLRVFDSIDQLPISRHGLVSRIESDTPIALSSASPTPHFELRMAVPPVELNLRWQSATTIQVYTGVLSLLPSLPNPRQKNLKVPEYSPPRFLRRLNSAAYKQKHGDGSTFLQIVECYYIGFTLVPKASLRVIAPIMAKVKAGYPVQQKAYTDVRRTVVLADPQIGYRKNQRTNELDPFHDRNALDVAFQITRQFQPDTIVINGDWLDMSEWSDKFTREPEFFFTTQPALFETHFWLQKLRRTNPNARIVYIEGNHEVRLRNSIVNHLASLASFVSVSLESIGSLSTLLGLESLGIEYLGGYPNNFVLFSNIETQGCSITS